MAAKSWLPINPSSPFSLANIPFGVVSKLGTPGLGSIAVAMGDFVIVLNELRLGGAFASLPCFQPYLHMLSEDSLNAFAALGRTIHNQVRLYIRDLLLEHTQ